MALIRPTTTWQSLGNGPLDVQVLTGTVVLQASDRVPAPNDLSGTVVSSVVGALPSRLEAGEWWAKALVTETAISVVPVVAATAVVPATGAAAASGTVSSSLQGSGTAGVDLAAALIVVLAADGTLRPASSRDPSQFGLVAGFTLLAAAAGAPVPFTRRSSLTDTAWALTPGDPVYVGQDGGITQLEPTVGFAQVAGLVLTATTIVADFGPPILL